MKKLVATILCLCMLFGALPLSASASTGFKDVPETSWYADTVKYTVSKGLMQGVGNGRFEPNTAMSRAMFVQVLSNRATNFDKETYKNPVNKDFSIPNFKDIKTSDWFYPSVQWAAVNMITEGTAADKFSPHQTLNREQAVKLLYFYAIRCGENTSAKGSLYNTFADTNKVSGWAKMPMQWAVNNGIIKGVSQNRLDPKGKLTRAQAAQLFRNLDEKMKYTDPLAFGKGTVPENEASSYLELTFAELSKDTPNVKREDEGYSGSFLYTFNGYEEFYFLYPASDHGANGLPRSDAKPLAVMAALETVFPDLCGLSYGDAVRKMGGSLKVAYSVDGELVNYFVGQIETEEYFYWFTFSEGDTIGNDSLVIIL